MELKDLPDGDRILASAVRFLIDGQQHDLASMLPSCTLRAESLVPGHTDGYEVTFSLTGPRPVYELLYHSSYFDETTSVIQWAIARAIGAVLPVGVSIRDLCVRAELIDIDPNWRQELIDIARGKEVHNQAVEAQTVFIWENHRFCSKTEIRVAQALEKHKVLYFPNCKARLGISTRENRYPDFLVCDHGKWGILEVDGEPYHPASRTVEDHERDRLFLAHGIKLVQHFDSGECFERADKVVEKFLYLLRQS